jgi:hypothetical protein
MEIGIYQLLLMPQQGLLDNAALIIVEMTLILPARNEMIR